MVVSIYSAKDNIFAWLWNGTYSKKALCLTRKQMRIDDPTKLPTFNAGCIRARASDSKLSVIPKPSRPNLVLAIIDVKRDLCVTRNF